MLRHVLAQEDVDGKRIKALEAKGIRSFKRLVQISPMELSHVLDVSMAELERLLGRVALRSCPQPTSAFDMFMQSVNAPSSLRTTLPELDRGMYGGIPCGAITELAGVSGIGKSQFCMMLAVLCALEHPDATILYFNSGHNFSAKRLIEIALARLPPLAFPSDEARQVKVDAIARQIRVASVTSLDELHSFLSAVAADLTDSCKMLVVDSLASLAHESALEMSLAKRQMLLMNVASNLKYLAAAAQAFVVVTNHATTKHTGDGLTYSHPALGVAWAHSITIRIVLERTTSFQRTMTILKSSMSPHVSFPFEFHRAGLVMAAASRDVDNEEDEFDDDVHWADVVLPAVDDHSSLLVSQSQRSADGDGDHADSLADALEEAPAAPLDAMFDIVPNSDSEDAWDE
ncbi:hypothetical protein ACHHYP_10770 [Achlya hypogyna]|uniref:RecA family profile 1 domain-containing protein n=1 Tax=Achlya hypogyna TaxID=1202772 RepID=A0A1V9YKS9_ACHHY|nr:hypothetical protein ACHHYP_10770 [Achlya hypogyna]